MNPLGLSSEGSDPSIWGTGVKRSIHRTLTAHDAVPIGKTGMMVSDGE